ncbi:MAG: FHA domain-containing protein [Myxococcales bacterium]
MPYLEGYRPNLIEAVRLDLQDLVADGAALKLLLVITDGRDFADPKGDGPGDFAALGREIRKAGVKLLIVGYPPPEADATQAATNLRDLQEAAGGFLRSLDQVQDLENTLESLGQSVADLQQVRLPAPRTWRVFGGSHRLSVRLATGDGQQLSVDLGGVVVGGGRPWWILLVVVVGLALIAVASLWVARRRGQPPATDEGAVLAVAHDLVRRGASPSRAAEELTRSYPESLKFLTELGPDILSDSRFPYFRTRLGRLRLQEIREILGKKALARPALGEGLAKALSDALAKGLEPERAAEAVTGQVAADELTAFSALDLDQLAEALRGATRGHPSLGSPRARGAAVAIQDALRSGRGTTGVAVGWLVRTGGPGPRGETLRLANGQTLIGQAADCQLRILGDPGVAAKHCRFSVEDGQFMVAPIEGSISIEGVRAERGQALSDGETIALGGGLFVFKCASAGNLARPTIAPSRGRQRAR